ncbi:hypothetical protein [Kordiimonas pumila]|uniref:Uncharacterized protein n=1 Tax=Kordiimonas pumila TaxID=2161677 RepID=A0ABV7DAS4_9PROT|nr:hypothetical protein [Kordiimonas pumila]
MQEKTARVTVSSPMTSQADEVSEWPVTWFETFKLAPGRHGAFMCEIALADEVAKAGGPKSSA